MKEMVALVIWGIVGYFITGFTVGLLFPNLSPTVIVGIATLGAFVTMWFIKE